MCECLSYEHKRTSVGFKKLQHFSSPGLYDSISSCFFFISGPVYCIAALDMDRHRILAAFGRRKPPGRLAEARNRPGNYGGITATVHFDRSLFS
jgi:hypothetical protein